MTTSPRLLFSGCFFGQVLEGRTEVVVDKIKRISADPRHADFKLLVERPITIREYGDWSMGYLHDLGLEDALEEFLTSRTPPAERLVVIMDRMRPDTVMGALT